jgi:hypothetical protein
MAYATLSCHQCQGQFLNVIAVISFKRKRQNLCNDKGKGISARESSASYQCDCEGVRLALSLQELLVPTGQDPLPSGPTQAQFQDHLQKSIALNVVEKKV